MASKAPYYNLLKDFVEDGGDPHYISTSPHWALCVVRLGTPLSYDRKKGKSVTNDFSQGVKLRGSNLIIASDCTQLSISGSKEQHTKSLSAELKQTDHNYLVEILPGDWVLAWIVNDETKFIDLLDRIKKADPSDPCNRWDDGLKFVGRVDSVRKRMHLDRNSGTKTSSTTLTAVGFRELDSQFFYDQQLGEAEDHNLGSWLAKVGLDLQRLFSVDIKNGQKNNSRALINALLDLLVGKGVNSKSLDQADESRKKKGGNEHASLHRGAGAGSVADGEAPFAYVVPRIVGALLGKTNASKPGGIMSFADIMETLTGVQTFGASGASAEPQAIFTPKLDAASQPERMYTGDELLGTFLPLMPDFVNKPLWSVLQQFLNPVVNEMYTTLRVNDKGFVVPMLVVRQIPFTTEAFANNDASSLASNESGPLLQGQVRSQIKTTPFLSVPRWLLSSTMVNDIDIGRSDATRINFVHVYGQDSNAAEQVPFSSQLSLNPPARDDLDIQRSGLRSYMTTVACALKDTVGATPSTWIALTADRLIGSQYTLNGTIQSVGIQSPIAEGDNLEWDGTVFHIEGYNHQCHIEPGGNRSFTTMLTLTNGMRANGAVDVTNSSSGNSGNDMPIYPGLHVDDNRAYDPGYNIEDKYDRTPPSVATSDLEVPAPPGSPPRAVDKQEQDTIDFLNKL
jgi:hypothetical protein